MISWIRAATGRRRQIELSCPDFVDEMRQYPEELANRILDIIGKAEVKRVLESSSIARRMVEVVKKESANLPVQVAVLGVLT